MLNNLTSPATPTPRSSTTASLSLSAAPLTNQFSGYQIIRRNGSVVPFAPEKIAIAMMKAFFGGARYTRRSIGQRTRGG